MLTDQESPAKYKITGKAQQLLAERGVGLSGGYRRRIDAAAPLGEVRRHATGLVARQPVGRRAALRFIVELKITERLPGSVLHYERLGVLIDYPGRWEAARGGHGAM